MVCSIEDLVVPLQIQGMKYWRWHLLKAERVDEALWYPASSRFSA